jgi:hypothetical protein
MTGLTDDQKKILRELVERGYVPAVEQLTKGLSAPYWWHDQRRPEGSLVQGGTICFVHTGARLLGITAGHIHREITALRAEQPGAWCQIGGSTFEPERRLIDEAEHPDIATYDVSERSGERCWSEYPFCAPMATGDRCGGHARRWRLALEPKSNSDDGDRTSVPSLCGPALERL